MRVVELFSGLGGLRLSLEFARAFLRSSRPKDVDDDEPVVYEAFDINMKANMTYKLNFGESPSNRDISSLGPSIISGCDVLIMSPPCQPYTQKGDSKMFNGNKTGDWDDNRNSAFRHLVDTLLGQVADPPKFIFLENVRGFETSTSYERVYTRLVTIGYQIETFLLCPTSLGIPNIRVRFYLIARLKRHCTVSIPFNASPVIVPSEHSHVFPSPTLAFIQCNIKSFLAYQATHRLDRSDPSSSLENDKIRMPLLGQSPAEAWDWSAIIRALQATEPQTLHEYLGEEEDRDSKLRIDPVKFAKVASTFIFDAPYPSSTACGAITKGYGRLVGRSGPVIPVTSDYTCPIGETPSTLFRSKDEITRPTSYRTKHLSEERFRLLPNDTMVRWMSPHEIKTLLLFPGEYSFPASMPNVGQWKLLGNSVNVGVIGLLMIHMLREETEHQT